MNVTHEEGFVARSNGNLIVARDVAISRDAVGEVVPAKAVHCLPESVAAESAAVCLQFLRSSAESDLHPQATSGKGKLVLARQDCLPCASFRRRVRLQTREFCLFLYEKGARFGHQ